MDDNERRVVEELNSYALECKNSHKYITAKIILERAIRMYPTAGILWNNYGAVMWNLNDYEVAEKAMKKATSLDYDNEISNTNLGLLYSSWGKWDEAAEVFKRAAELKPESGLVRWESSLMLLDKGDWEVGLREYDSRRNVKKEITPLKYPLWNGEDLNGKTIYIQSEQGLGDRILFSRYLHWIAKTWPTSKILYLCDPKLHNLFWDLKLETGLEFIPDRVPWPDADYGQYLMNLPASQGQMRKE